MFLALSKEYLSQLECHLFSGITKVTNGDLNNNSGFHQKYVNYYNRKGVNDLQRISSYMGLVRAIYWVFNFENYRDKYYGYQCYLMMHLYESYINMLNAQAQQMKLTSDKELINQQKNIVEANGGIFLNSINFCRHDFAIPVSEVTSFADKVRSFFPNIQSKYNAKCRNDFIEDYLLGENKDPLYFIVREELIIHLRALGINTHLYDVLSYSKVAKMDGDKLLERHMQFIKDVVYREEYKRLEHIERKNLISKFKEEKQKINEMKKEFNTIKNSLTKIMRYIELIGTRYTQEFVNETINFETSFISITQQFNEILEAAKQLEQILVGDNMNPNQNPEVQSLMLELTSYLKDNKNVLVPYKKDIDRLYEMCLRADNAHAEDASSKKSRVNLFGPFKIFKSSMKESVDKRATSPNFNKLSTI